MRGSIFYARNVDSPAFYLTVYRFFTELNLPDDGEYKFRRTFKRNGASLHR